LRIGIIGKSHSKEAHDIATELTAWLQERGVEVFIDEELDEKIGHGHYVQRNMMSQVADVVVVLGGDGTFLAAARLVSEADIPLLGVKLGRLGFLTEIDRHELYPMMEHVLRGDYTTEERNMLSVNIHRTGDTLGGFVVLNDAVVNKGAVARIIDLQLLIDGKYITTFKADGIIVATPTGSTAYSLSAGGPIVYPTLPVTIITPICPHILTNRPLVVSSEANIKLEITAADSTDIFLTLDGRGGIPLRRGDVVEVVRAQHKVRIIKSPFSDFFRTLKAKLRWGEGYVAD